MSSSITVLALKDLERGGAAMPGLYTGLSGSNLEFSRVGPGPVGREVCVASPEAGDIARPISREGRSIQRGDKLGVLVMLRGPEPWPAWALAGAAEPPATAPTTKLSPERGLGEDKILNPDLSSRSSRCRFRRLIQHNTTTAKTKDKNTKPPTTIPAICRRVNGLLCFETGLPACEGACELEDEDEDDCVDVVVNVGTVLGVVAGVELVMMSCDVVFDDVTESDVDKVLSTKDLLIVDDSLDVVVGLVVEGNASVGEDEALAAVAAVDMAVDMPKSELIGTLLILTGGTIIDVATARGEVAVRVG